MGTVWKGRGRSKVSRLRRGEKTTFLLKVSVEASQGVILISDTQVISIYMPIQLPAGVSVIYATELCVSLTN
jgi:hypothetical protein